MPFQKGRSGNPAGKKPGTLNKTTKDVRELSRKIVEDPEGLKRLQQDYQRGRLSPAIFIELMNRAYGKVKDKLDVDQHGSVEYIQVTKHPKEEE